MSSVKVNMNMCDKVCMVKATLRDDGDLNIEIVSDCTDVQSYGNRLKKITVNDAVDYEHSAINSMEMRGNLSPHCLVPSAVFDAAWLELGMISKSLVKKIRTNTVQFVDENGDLL